MIAMEHDSFDVHCEGAVPSAWVCRSTAPYERPPTPGASLVQPIAAIKTTIEHAVTEHIRASDFMEYSLSMDSSSVIPVAKYVDRAEQVSNT